MPPASAEPMPPTLPRESRVVASRTQVSADLEGETVILSFDAGAYFGLDRVGTFVWRLMRTPVTMAALQDAMLARFEVDEARAWRDLEALVTEMIAKGLVELLPQDH